MYRAPSVSRSRDKSLTIYNPFAFTRDSNAVASFQGQIRNTTVDTVDKENTRRMSKSIHIDTAELMKAKGNDTEKNELLY